MGLNKLNNLYREVILDHAQHPRHNRKLDNYTHHMELLNPTCGDAIIVQLRLENDRIADIAFTGHGCTISIASASMMTETLLNQTLERAKELVQTFNTLITTDKIIPQKDQEQLQDAALFEGLRQFPSRYKCGILGWKAAELGLSSEAGQQKII